MVSTRMMLSGMMVAGIAATAPPLHCADVMNAYCNSIALQSCTAKIKADGGELPLVALDDVNEMGSGTAWRCYSPTCLDSTKTHYRPGSHCRLYCSTPALAEILSNCTHPRPAPSGREIKVNATNVWGAAKAVGCGQIRTPEITVTPSRVVLVGQCRNGNATARAQGLGDDMRTDQVVSIASTDGGRTWDPASFQTHGARGCSVAVAVYDAVRKTVVLQYQAFTSSNPYTGNTLYQATSTDDGLTWSTPRNITAALSQCNSGPGGQVCGAAGSRLQSVSGRLLFSGHNGGGGGGICVWYSDDGGATWNTTAGGGTNRALLITGNENSIADLWNGSLYMNGRGTDFPFAGHRASYWSHDDGTTWSPGVEAWNLVEPNTFGCDGAIVAVPTSTAAADGHTPPRLFFTEPSGPGGRISLRVWCSRDSGLSWDRYVGVNLGEVAAYSAVEVVRDAATREPTLLIVWEQSPTMLSYRLSIDDWCPEL